MCVSPSNRNTDNINIVSNIPQINGIILDRYNLLPVPNQQLVGGKFKLSDPINGPFITFNDLVTNDIFTAYGRLLKKPNIVPYQIIKKNSSNKNQLTPQMLARADNFNTKLFKSLQNIGNSCFYGSVIHLLQQIDFSSIDRNQINPAMIELYDLIVGNTGIATSLPNIYVPNSQTYTDAVIGMGQIPRQQQAADEFLNYVINDIFKIDIAANANFKSTEHLDIYHAAGNLVSQNNNFQSMIRINNLTEPTIKDTEELLIDNIAVITELNNYQNGSDKMFAYNLSYFDSFSDYIIVHNNVIQFPDIVINASLAKPNITIELTTGTVYLLAAVIYFIGTTPSTGHYVSTVLYKKFINKLGYIYYNDSSSEYAEIPTDTKYLAPTIFNSTLSTHIPVIMLYKKMKL